MKVHFDRVFECDMCRHRGPWGESWWSVTYLIDGHIEHEFHVCSPECSNNLQTMGNSWRKKLYEKVKK